MSGLISPGVSIEGRGKLLELVNRENDIVKQIQHNRYDSLIKKIQTAAEPAQVALQEISNKNNLIKQFSQGIQESFQDFQANIQSAGDDLILLDKAYSRLANAIQSGDDQFGVKLRKKMATFYKPPQVRQALKSAFGGGTDLKTYNDGSLGGGGRVVFKEESRLMLGSTGITMPTATCMKAPYSDANLGMEGNLFTSGNNPGGKAEAGSGLMSQWIGSSPESGCIGRASIVEFLTLGDQVNNIELITTIKSQYQVTSAAVNAVSLAGLDILVELFGAGGSVQRIIGNIVISQSAIAWAGAQQATEEILVRQKLQNVDTSHEYLLRVSILGTSMTGNVGWCSVFIQSQVEEMRLLPD